jgi:hypothetical protein
MFDVHQKSAGTSYASIAFLVIAFIPAASGVLFPFGSLAGSIAIASSLLCVALAWANWRSTSLRLAPLLAIRKAAAVTLRPSACAIGIFCTIAGPPLLYGVDFSTYRGLQLGMSISAAAHEVGMKSADAAVVHQRPAVIQEIQWQPQSPVLTDPLKADPMKEGLLYFYNGDLFRIVVTYDRYRIEGMTAEDMIEGISATYGTATRPNAQIAYHTNYGEVAPVVARWEDSEYSYNLVRTGDRSSFAMILYSKRLDALAQTAIVEAARLDAQEAPRRAVDKEKKREDDERIILEKARSLNKPNFRA